MINRIVLTAWDGAFWEAMQGDAALPALMASLKGKGVPVIVFTERDRAELEPIRRQWDWVDPFVTESGSGIFTPVNHNPFNPALGDQEGDYYVQELGCPYVQARAGLRVLANAIAHPLKGLGDFTVPQLQKLLGVTAEAAHQAKAREFSELFMTPKAVEPTVLVQAAEEMGFGMILRPAEESRFSELLGPEAGLAGAIAQLIAAYQNQLPPGETLQVIGLSSHEADLVTLSEVSAEMDWQGVLLKAEPTEWTAALANWMNS
jgi:mannosyl-3-phosphoglycerate phosphatase